MHNVSNILQPITTSLVDIPRKRFSQIIPYANRPRHDATIICRIFAFVVLFKDPIEPSKWLLEKNLKVVNRNNENDDTSWITYSCKFNNQVTCGDVWCHMLSIDVNHHIHFQKAFYELQSQDKMTNTV